MSSSLEICQNFQEALPTLRSVWVAHWAHAVASVLGVCFAGIHPAGKVRYVLLKNQSFNYPAEDVMALNSKCYHCSQTHM